MEVSPPRGHSSPPRSPSSEYLTCESPRPQPPPPPQQASSEPPSPLPPPPPPCSSSFRNRVPPPPSPPPPTAPELHVKLSLPVARYDKASPGLRLKLTARLAPHMNAPVSFHRCGTIFDELCPLLGRGGFWGVADTARKPVRLVPASSSAAQERDKKACTRNHAGGEEFLEFGENFVTLFPGQELVVEKLLPARELAALRSGEAYTVYSRPDRERKRPAKASKCKWGTREELAESAFWCSEEEDEEEEGAGGMWTRVDVSHIARDRGWFEMVVLVGNSVRFYVV